MSDVIATQSDTTPWYRVPWVWFVVCLPFSAVLFGIVMFVSANYQPDDLVVDDYYKKGMGINRRLHLDDQATVLGASVALQNITDEGAVFHIEKGGAQLNLMVFHVSDQDRDFETPLISLGDGIYTAASAKLSEILRAPGIWYVEVNDPENQWRLRKRITTPVAQLELVSG